jgi:hypothetical protein
MMVAVNPLKFRCAFARLYGVTTHIATAMRTLKLKKKSLFKLFVNSVIIAVTAV